MVATSDVVKRAFEVGTAIPAFNVPYLPMVEPVVRAVVDQDSLALIEVARLEWIRFESQSPEAVMAEFQKWNQPEHVRIHLDHIPVIDEDNQNVDYVSIIQSAIDLGYQSVMIDGSRLDLQANIDATKTVVKMAHEAGIPCEAELGAVLGHEAGPLPPYEELFESGKGFTDVAEAKQFVQETGCDWLSVAIGNVHGAVSGALKDKRKVEARLDLNHLERLRQTAGVPLVLHGGSGVKRDYVLDAITKGIAKINIGTEIRQAYETTLRSSASVAAAQGAVFERTGWLIRDYFGLANSRSALMDAASQERGS